MSESPDAALRQLARQVLAVLDAQATYFRASGPKKLDLIGACKKAERDLRAACEAVVSPPRAEPRLFEVE